MCVWGVIRGDFYFIKLEKMKIESFFDEEWIKKNGKRAKWTVIKMVEWGNIEFIWKKKDHQFIIISSNTYKWNEKTIE